MTVSLAGTYFGEHQLMIVRRREREAGIAVADGDSDTAFAEITASGYRHAAR
ncbi:hypothetical protein [Actinoplanes sp. M2I2]|uniref:hypothetical protein n=1 Tax=Actinoplanes sp. M2I2 TaxID=1734444 RepID=UPI0020227F9A|nr:hypothetical protein [Actinoplanes sp. M2I2]